MAATQGFNMLNGGIGMVSYLFEDKKFVIIIVSNYLLNYYEWLIILIEWL